MRRHGRKVIAALGILLASLSCAAAAQAAALDAQTLSTAQAAAAAEFPGAACEGRVHLDIVSGDEVARITGSAGATGAANISDSINCQMWIKDGLSQHEACETYVHEYAHLAGFEHSDDPDSAMNGSEHCASLLPVYLSNKEARSALRQHLGAGWKVTCLLGAWSSTRGGLRECRAARTLSHGGTLRQRWTVDRVGLRATGIRRGWQLPAL